MDRIVSFKNVSFTYPSSKTKVIDNISFDIERNSWTSIVGHNGSGKSTLTRLINGLLIPDIDNNSKILVDNLELNDENLWRIRDKVGIVFQNPDNQFVGATVGDDVAFGLENRGIARDQMIQLVKKTVDQVGMSDYLDAEPANLSGGQKQRVAIAGILAVHPKVLILDEATSMLDPSGREQIISLVKKVKEEHDLTVISITHDIDEAIDSDQVIVLNDGKILAQDKPENIFNNSYLVAKAGLEEPFIYKLIARLNQEGMKIPENVLSQKELVKYLCQLNSNM